MNPALIIALPLLAAPLAGLLGRRSLLVLGAVALADAVLAGLIAFGPRDGEVLFLVEGYFRLDATSRLFLLLINMLVLGVATYVWTRVLRTPQLEVGLNRFVRLALVLVACCNLAVLSNHLIAMWSFIELSALVAAPLIQHGGGQGALKAAYRYLVFSSAGLALALLGFGCLARSLELTGHETTFFFNELAPVATSAPDLWRKLGLALVILGFGTKLGLAPMYAWLPETYASAPPAVTTLLATVQFNVVLVAMIRVLQVYRDVEGPLITFALVTIGLSTMAVSCFGIISTKNYKRLIAYASLNHGGVIAIGLGLGKVAAYGAMLYVVSNAIIKAILFQTAGKISSQYRSEDIRQVSGLIKDLPHSGMFFLVGTFALLGFPPFGSFLGELLIMSALVSGGHFTVFVVFGAILMITFIATGRSVFPMIWGPATQPVAVDLQPRVALLPKYLFLAFLVAMGLYLPAPISALFLQVASTLGAQ